MTNLSGLIETVLHLDRVLGDVLRAYGPWTYGILALIVFCETGLVVTPFLPGDSLLFAAGALAVTGGLDPVSIIATLWAAALLGDLTNYHVGYFAGERLFKPGSRVFNRRHLERTHAFYEKYGGKTIVLARFVPIVRTFAPFVAGIGRMGFVRFVSFSMAGGLLWTASLVSAGYFFGTRPWVKDNFSVVILGVIAVSILPAVVEVLRAWGRRSSRPAGEPNPLNRQDTQEIKN